MSEVPIYFKVDLQIICTTLIDNVDRLTKRQSEALLKALTQPPQQEELLEESQLERYCKFHGLSSRQCQILELLTKGLSTNEIANHLHITSRTVDSHLAIMFGKTGCVNRTQLAIASVSTTIG